MSKYLRDQASARDDIRHRLLGHRALPITDAPAMPATSSRPIQTTSGLEGLLQQLAANLAPKGVAQVATPELKVMPGGMSRASGDGGGGAQDSGLGGALGGLFDNLGKSGGVQKAAENLAKASGRANLKDMVTRGRKPELTPQQKADRARDLIPGLKPGVEAPKVEPGRASAEAYQTQQRKDIPPVVGVDKNAPQSEGYKADLKYLNDNGGHATKVINGVKTHVPLGEKGNYDDINPELAARLAEAGRRYEKETGQKPKFGESSRGDDVQHIYWEESAHGTKYAAARPSDLGGRGSNHMRGTAMDVPPSNAFHGWLTKNKDSIGLDFPVSGDAPHVEMHRKYKGPNFAKETKEFGPGVVDTSKLPAMDTSKPAYAGVKEPPGGWQASRLTTPADQIKMQTPPVTAPPRAPSASPPEAGAPAPGVPPELSKLVMSKEWFVPTPKDDYGRKTIGYGTDARGRTSITEPEARAEMNAQLAQHLKTIDQHFPNVSPGVRNSLASLSYNVGEGWVTEPGGRLAAALKAGDMKAAKEVFKEFKHVHVNGQKQVLQGLVNRRNDEARAFDGQAPLYTKNPDAPPGSQPDVAAAPPPVKVAGPVPASAPPVDPYRKSRPAHDLLETKMADLAAQHMPSMAAQAKSMFGDQSLRSALGGMYGGMIKSRLMPELPKYGIDPAEFEKAIVSPKPPPPPEVKPTPAPTQASAPAAPAAAPAPPLTPAEVKAAADAPQPTAGTWQGDLARTAGPGSPGTVEVPVPPQTTTEISVRPAPPPLTEAGPAAGEARGGGAGVTAPAALPVEDATETAKPEGAGAGDSTMLPPVTVEEGATDAPGFYGAPPGEPHSDLPPGELNARWNERIYEATDRPTMIRDERLGYDPHPSFNEFRKSENIDDRRLDSQLTPEQKAQYAAQSDSPKGQFRYTPAEHEAALAKTDTPLARAAGSKQLENLELNAAMKTVVDADGNVVAQPLPPDRAKVVIKAAEIPQAAAEPATLDPASQPAVQDAEGNISTVRTMGIEEGGKEVNIPTVPAEGGRIMTDEEAVQRYKETGKHLGKHDTEAEAAAAAEALHQEEAKQISQHPQGEQQAPPQVTPEMAKALEAAVKDESRIPQFTPPPDAQPVLPPSSQPGGPGKGLSLAPPGLQLPPGAAPGVGPFQSAFMPGSQGGSIALAGLAPAQSGVFSTPLLDAAAQQQPTIGQGNLAPFSWAAPMSWGWGGSSGGSGFGGMYSGGSAFDFGGGGGFSDLGGGLGSGMGFFGSSFGG